MKIKSRETIISIKIEYTGFKFTMKSLLFEDVLAGTESL